MSWARSSVESGRWEVGLGCQRGEGGHTRVGGQEVNVCEGTLTPSQLGGGVGPMSSAHSLLHTQEAHPLDPELGLSLLHSILDPPTPVPGSHLIGKWHKPYSGLRAGLHQITSRGIGQGTGVAGSEQ